MIPINEEEALEILHWIKRGKSLKSLSKFYYTPVKDIIIAVSKVDNLFSEAAKEGLSEFISLQYIWEQQ